MVTSLLVLARCGGFVFRAPGFSHPSVPAPLRAGFAVALTVLIAPAAGHGVPRVDGTALVAAVATELLLGAALGMTASLLYDAAYAGGRIVDDYVGVKAIAPSIALVAPSGFGRVWSLAFTGAFFLTGAYRLTLLALARSFTRIPPAAPLPQHGWIAFAQNYCVDFVGVAVDVAAPAMGLAFVVQIAVGAVSRVVPRFGSFMLAFPLAFAAALIATAIAVPLAAEHVPPPGVSVPGVAR